VSELPEFGLGYPGTELRRVLVEAVLDGRKTATAGLHGAFEDEPTPSAGDRFVMEDDRGVPRAIVFESVEDRHAAYERFFERTIEPETLIEAVRFRVVERL
jgi:uncharacterized protein YhfF